MNEATYNRCHIFVVMKSYVSICTARSNATQYGLHTSTSKVTVNPLSPPSAPRSTSSPDTDTNTNSGSGKTICRFMVSLIVEVEFGQSCADQGRRSHGSWGVMTPHFSRQRGTGTKLTLKTQRKLETKASSHEGQCIPAGYFRSHMLLHASAVNYNLNSKYTKYFAQLCGRIFTFSNISTTH